MPKYRKLSGTHYRVENGKEICYLPGSVIEVEDEDELRVHDERLASWQRVDDDTPSTGSSGRSRTKENFRFIRERSSKILHPELCSVTDIIDPVDELHIRTSTAVQDKKPVGLLAKAKFDLEEAIARWHYANDTQPVSNRSDGPPQSEAISRLQAEVEVLELEIDHLKKITHGQRSKEVDKVTKVEEQKKEQAETLAYHPHFKDHPAAKAVREKMTKKLPAKKTIKRGASAQC